MRLIALLLLFALFPQQSPQMTEPKIQHHDEVSTQHYDRVEITCPEGYEGHLVIRDIGFDGTLVGDAMMFSAEGGSGRQYFTICFKVDFMDKIRKNKEMTRWIAPPRSL